MVLFPKMYRGQICNLDTHPGMERKNHEDVSPMNKIGDFPASHCYLFLVGMFRYDWIKRIQLYTKQTDALKTHLNHKPLVETHATRLKKKLVSLVAGQTDPSRCSNPKLWESGWTHVFFLRQSVCFTIYLYIYIANDKYLEHVFEKFPRYHIFEVSTLRTLYLEHLWFMISGNVSKTWISIWCLFLEDPNKNQVPIWTLPEWACNFHLGNLPKLIVLYKHGVIGEWNLVSGCYTLTLRTYIRCLYDVLSIGVLSVRVCYVLSVRFFLKKNGSKYLSVAIYKLVSINVSSGKLR